MSWIDTTVIIVVVVLGLLIFYRALKEPLDLVFGAIGRGIKGGFDKLSSMRESNGYDVISYGG